MGLMDKVRKATRNTPIARAARAVREKTEDAADRLNLGDSVRTWTRADASAFVDPRKQFALVKQSTIDATKLAPRAAAAYLTMGASEVPNIVRAAGSYNQTAGAVASIAATAYGVPTAPPPAAEGESMNFGGLANAAAGMYQSYSSGQGVSNKQIAGAIGSLGNKSAKSKSAPATAKAFGSKAGDLAGRLGAGAPPSVEPKAAGLFGVSPLILVGAAVVLVALLTRR